MGLLAVLLGVAVASTFISGEEVRRGMHQAIEIDATLSRVANQIAIDTLQCRGYEKDLLLQLNDEQQRADLVRRWHDAFTRLEESLAQFDAVAAETEDRLQSRQWRAQATSYRKAFASLEQAITAGQASTLAQARGLLLPADERLHTLTITSVAVATAKAATAQQTGSTLVTQSQSYQRWTSLLGIVGLIVALIWSVAFPYYLVRPVLLLTAAARRIATGDLSARTRIEGRDELGVLSQSFNSMAETIEQRSVDLEVQYAASEAARSEAEAARGAIAAQLVTIEQQREAIRELSVPVLPITDQTLVMPLIGALDTRRLNDLQHEALTALEQSRARQLVLDVTGVPVVDTQVAQGLIRVVHAARLLGAEVTLVGIRPEVAQTIVGLGLDLREVHTESTLQQVLGHRATVRP
ncbi:MAG: HAMP domain-containing protein [Chloroflexales bacterium]|nr:HAMP domain-containing protein [Chloroflexales bacterium]